MARPGFFQPTATITLCVAGAFSCSIQLQPEAGDGPCAAHGRTHSNLLTNHASKAEQEPSPETAPSPAARDSF